MSHSLASLRPSSRATMDRRAGTQPGRSRDLTRAAPAVSHALRSNQALLRALPAVQAKLDVGPSGDAFEREADATADRILRSSVPKEEERKQRDDASTVRRAPERKRADERKKGTAVQRAEAGPDHDKKKKKDDGKPAIKRRPESSIRRETDPALLEEEDFVERLRAKRDSSAAPPVPEALEQTLRGRRGGGQQMSSTEREFFEPQFGHDLSAVRLHTDAAAARAAHKLQAQAFTYGPDIYFAAGRYRPDSDAGRHLLAHELTHTVQQGAAGDRLQRAPDPAPTSAPTGAPATATSGAAPAATTAMDPATIPLEHGRPDLNANTLTFDRIQIPGFKMQGHRGALYQAHKPLKQRRAYDRGNPAQREVWRNSLAANVGKARDRVAKKISDAHAGHAAEAGATHVLSAPSKYSAELPRYFLGTPEGIAQEMVLPSWDRQGNPHSFDVDHIVELQLANWNTETWANDLPNMELLDSAVNQESGRVIFRTIESRVNDFITHTGGQFGATPRAVKQQFTLVFNDVAVGSGGAPAVTEAQYWTKEHLEAGEHVNEAVKPVSPDKLGRQGRVLIFPTAAGGVPKTFTWPGNITLHERDWLKPYVVTSKQFNVGEGAETADTLGTLTFNIASDDSTWHPFEGGDQAISVRRVPGAQFAGSIDKSRVRDTLRGLRVKRMSPIEIDTFDVLSGRGLVLEGRILPELPLLKDTQLNFELADGDLRVYKEFAIGDFTLPRPFTVNDSSLTLSLGTRTGLSVEGRLAFGIERVGQGEIVGRRGTAGGLEVEGRFDFDTRLFDPAQIRLAYRDGQLTGQGTLGIPEGRVRGIRNATITIDYANETLTANGTAVLSIPGVQQAGINVVYSEAEGLMIGGNVQLANDIPGIRGGSIDATVRKPADSDEYTVTARGTAIPAIPGIESTLTVEYDNGILSIEGQGAYSRGMLSGSLRIGATNRPLDPGGNPLSDAQPTDTLRAYGGGQLTIRIAPWLQGTVGVRLLANGELEISGQIALPGALDLFPEKRLDRNIFSIGLDIPIVGVAIAGQRIGIFATIRGGLDASAGIGPGQLQQLALGITYNPAHEDETRVTGDAKLAIPASAGLRLFVRGGLGAGIPVVSATAALEIGGSLGLQGVVEADVHVDWTPSRGLSIDAAGAISVEPKFKFDVTGMVLVEADLLVTTIELYEKRWNLAQFEYGSNLRFGVRFPIHYREGQPFEVPLSDVEFDVPPVDPQALLSDLVARIA